MFNSEVSSIFALEIDPLLLLWVLTSGVARGGVGPHHITLFFPSSLGVGNTFAIPSLGVKKC